MRRRCDIDAAAGARRLFGLLLAGGLWLSP